MISRRVLLLNLKNCKKNSGKKRKNGGSDASVKGFLSLRFWSVVVVFAPLSGLFAVASVQS